MTDIRKWTLAGITGLLVVGMLSTVGCSSSDDKTGSGGSTGNGGAGGSSAAVVVPGAIIADFGGTPSPYFGGSPYQGSGQGWAAPTVTSTGSLHIALDSGPSTMMYAYAYVGIPLNDPPVNATPAAGVTFTVSGTVTGTGCQIQYSTVDQDHALTDNHGHCTAADGCYPSSKVFAISATPTPVTVLWADQTGGMATAAASAEVNKAQVLNLQWQIQGAGTVGESCVADVTIDDVKWQ